jgi:hypothetical protein
MTRAFSSTGMGLFEGGQVEGILPTMGDMFGFSDLAQAAAAAAAGPQVKLTGSPALDALNIQDMAVAKARLDEFKMLADRIQYVTDGSKKNELNHLINDKYSGGGFLKASKYSLADLAKSVQAVVSNGGQFYYYKSLTDVSDRNHGYLTDMEDGLKKLRDAMSGLFILPTAMTTKEIIRQSGIDPATLWAQAQASAAKARQSKNPADIGAAYALAESVQMEGTYAEDAVALMAEMEALGASVGTSAKEVAHKESKSEGVGKAAGLSTLQMSLIAGSAIALVAGIIYFTRK